MSRAIEILEFLIKQMFVSIVVVLVVPDDSTTLFVLACCLLRLCSCFPPVDAATAANESSDDDRSDSPRPGAGRPAAPLSMSLPASARSRPRVRTTGGINRAWDDARRCAAMSSVRSVRCASLPFFRVLLLNRQGTLRRSFFLPFVCLWYLSQPADDGMPSLLCVGTLGDILLG